MSPTFLFSAQAVMLLAFFSAVCRAGVNSVDRYQIGFRSLSICQVSLWNNLLPAIVMVMLCLCFGLRKELWSLLFQWKTVCFSGLVQLVAYSFSFAFRHSNVNRVTIMAKLSDFFIPVGIFFTTAHWSWSSYGFAIMTTVVCLPLLQKSPAQKKDPFFKRAPFFIIVALVLQASLAPFLIMPPSDGVTAGLHHTLLFMITILCWRSAWSLLPMLFRGQAISMPVIQLCWNPIFLLRVSLSIFTQLFFLLAIAGPNALVAWPILNSTGIFGLFFSRRFLKENSTRLEQGVVVTITLLELARFFSF